MTNSHDRPRRSWQVPSVDLLHRARWAAEAAARTAGIDPTGLTLLRVGENVILLLPAARVVARVAPSVALLDSVRQELRVATWLAEAGLPAVRPRDREPFVASEMVVSFWEYIHEIEATDVVTVARFLVHGDAHNENLVRSGDGRIVFLDLERVGVGQPEWDLTLTAVYHECGWHSATD